MKVIIKCIMLLIFSISSISAISQGINFQGVARSANGTILASQNISLRLSLLPKSVNSTPEYVEIRTVLTNAQGIFSIVVGDPGTITTIGSFSNVNWKEPLKYLKVDNLPSCPQCCGVIHRLTATCGKPLENCEIYHINKSNRQRRVAQFVSGLC